MHARPAVLVRHSKIVNKWDGNPKSERKGARPKRKVYEGPSHLYTIFLLCLSSPFSTELCCIFLYNKRTAFRSARSNHGDAGCAVRNNIFPSGEAFRPGIGNPCPQITRGHERCQGIFPSGREREQRWNIFLEIRSFGSRHKILLGFFSYINASFRYLRMRVILLKSAGRLI